MTQQEEWDAELNANFRYKMHRLYRAFADSQEREREARGHYAIAVAARKKAQAELEAAIEADARPLPLFDGPHGNGTAAPAPEVEPDGRQPWPTQDHAHEDRRARLRVRQRRRLQPEHVRRQVHPHVLPLGRAAGASGNPVRPPRSNAVNVPTIELPRGQALAAYREYRAAVRDNPNPEDRACMLGYKALAKGQAILHLKDAVLSGGFDASGRPALAVAGAHWKWCHCYRWTDGELVFGEDARRIWHGRRTKSGSVRFPPGTCPVIPAGGGRFPQCRAVVPTIPPRLRPPAALHNYHVLFEAAWEDVSGDPLLLRHLAGDLYAVLAVWGLTPLEQAVLRGRLVR